MPEQSFDTDCRNAVDELRAALLALYRSVGADPSHPQDVSRQFKVNKNLTWKAAKVLETEDSLAAALLLPGASGLNILVDKLASSGQAADEVVANVRRAGELFERMIEVHTEDRANLELILDSMGGGDKPLVKSRQQSYRGNSGIWGIQCDTQLITRITAPSRTKRGFLDQALITGWTDVRRLRPLASWPLIRLALRDDTGASERTGHMPLTEAEGDGAWMLRGFGSGAAPDIKIRREGEAIAFHLGEGQVGKKGAFTCYFGYIFPEAVPRYVDERNQFGEFRHDISIPAKTLLLDLIVHNDLAEMLETEVSIYSKLRSEDRVIDESQRVPMAEALVDKGPNPNVANPLVDRYAELVDTAMSRGGWDKKDFRLLRLKYEYPPIHTMARIRYPLPVAVFD